MGKPLSRPDCLRQSPRCLGKGDEDEAYIEDCYVPQRSIYDTMRINEQIDQGTKLCQPSRTTLGSGVESRGEGSTLSSNGTIGADLGGVFLCRPAENPGGVKKLDERVIFDALKLTGDAQIMSPPRRHQGGDKKDNPNRRSWKAFMPPSFPEFAERLELSSAEGTEKRLSGAGSPLSPLQPAPFSLTPSTPTSSTPSLTPYVPSPLSSAPHTPPVEEHRRTAKGFLYGGLPLSPCISQEGNEEGLLGWASPGCELRERTASELKFEEDERRILEELEDEDQEKISTEAERKEEVEKKERDLIEEEMAEREEREWEAVLKMDNRELITQSWDKETLEAEGWDLTASSGHWPLLTPPTGFEGLGAPSASPCLSSGAESDDLFLELERQCQEEEGVEMSVDSEPLCDPYSLPCLEEEEGDEEENCVWVDFKETLSQNAVTSADTAHVALEETCSKHIDIENSESKKAQDHQREHGFIDEDFDFKDKDAVKMEEEEKSCPTDSALGQLLESDSSGAFVAQPDRTGLSDVTQVCDDYRPTLSETDLDSGASSEHDEADYEERASSLCHSPLNPYAEEQMKLIEGEIKAEEESVTEWDANDTFASSLDNSKGVLLDDSLEPRHMTEKDIDSECKQDVDPQTSCGDEAVSLNPSEPFMVTDCDTEGSSVVSDTENLVFLCDVASGLNMPDQAPDLETAMGVTASTPKSDSFVLTLPQPTDSVPSSLSQSSLMSDACGAQSKDSEAFVMSDSFVYLAVSVPAQYPSDCPPSPLGDSIPPSPVLKVPSIQNPGGEEDEGGFILSPDSFVYMAAPERPQPGSSDIGSACEETQELDLDSYSEGNQSGLDGVEFFLGSMTGDSDWESDGSTLDFPAVVSRGQVWDQLEPGLLQNLFAQSETSQQSQVCVPEEDGAQIVVPSCSTDLETTPDSKNEENEPASEQCSETETQLKVCLNFLFSFVLLFGGNFMKVGLSNSCKLF
uniref:Uncharacterized protein n=1 Tax=Oryzias melastigma TaxID=30732 RepID=A0A3B3DQS7_ORYME